jgi:hypothetical protein
MLFLTSEQISHGVPQTANRKLLATTGLQVQKEGKYKRGQSA